MSTLQNDSGAERKGLLAGAVAFTLWGLLPVYWKTLSGIPAPEILGHRILWSALLLVFVLFFNRGWTQVKDALRNHRLLGMLGTSGVILGVNWLIYIWAVNSGHVLESSLGYFITPLFNMLLGFLVFRDRMRPMQWLAIALAASGVLFVLIRYGEIPWIAFGLSVTFAFYGLLRKLAKVDPIVGLFIETTALAPFALLFLGWLSQNGNAAFPTSSGVQNILLPFVGVVTSVPLVLFAFSARRVSMVTVGFLQYLSPTFQFLLGLFLYGEPFSTAQAVAFGCIWLALALYSIEGFLFLRRASETA